MSGYVVHERELQADRNGYTAARVVAIDSSNGSSLLELHLTRYAPGRSSPRTLEGVQEIMYVVSGSGSLAVGGESHAGLVITEAFQVRVDRISARHFRDTHTYSFGYGVQVAGHDEVIQARTSHHPHGQEQAVFRLAGLFERNGDRLPAALDLADFAAAAALEFAVLEFVHHPSGDPFLP